MGGDCITGIGVNWHFHVSLDRIFNESESHAALLHECGLLMINEYQ